MGYHPETLVLGFPHYKGCLAKLEPWIGFDIWHIDPEKRCEGQRSDDSCGWFDRRPQEYGDAVRYLLKDDELTHEVQRSLNTRVNVTGLYGHTFPRMPLSETLAVCLLVARELETRRWWNGQHGKEGACARPWLKAFTRQRRVDDIAYVLALTVYDNLSSVEEPESMIRMIASALHRRFRPWWRHPRWHVHHWKINFHLTRNLKRMVTPCATCGKALGFGYSPISDGQGLHHHPCLGVQFGSARASSDDIKANLA